MHHRQSQKIPDIAVSAPVPFGHSFLPYTTLNLPPTSPLNMQYQEWVQGELLRERLRTEALRDLFVIAQSRPPDYEPPDSGDVQTAIDTLNARINTVWQASTRCYYDYNMCSLPSLDSLPAAPRWIAPSAPSGLTASVSGAAVVLRWNDNSSNETGFEVYRKLSSSGTWTRLVTTAPNLVEFTDATALSEVAHDYFVRALNGGSASLPTNTVSATPSAVIRRTLWLDEELTYGGSGAFNGVRNSTTTFTLAGAADLQASFDFWFFNSTSYSVMQLDLRFVLDGAEVARHRFPNYSTNFGASLGRVSAGTHTLWVEASPVLVSGPPSKTKLYGYSKRGCYSMSCGIGESTLRIGITTP